MSKPSAFKVIQGSIAAPCGFRTAAVFCDIKRLGTGKGSNKGQKRDLALIVSDVSAMVAGMFTTSQVCAAPVKVSIKRVASGYAQAVVVNSGNANACTGRQGMKDAEAMARATASALGLQTEQVLVCSTGRIGVALPMANVRLGITAASKLLNSSIESAHQVTEAIMTSDTRPKTIAVEFNVGGKTVRIGGTCKGAGMIQPGMSPTGARPASGLHATMLGFITTDVRIDPMVLKSALKTAVAQSFNRITVDGDMSTNDTVLILANGESKNPKIGARSTKDREAFQTALNFVSLELAKMIVRDGEGASHFVTVRVNGAKTPADADAAARAVANGALVKTSWFGGDPNWGRILGALGASKADLIEEKIDVGYSLPGTKKIIYALKKGQPTPTPFKELCNLVANPEFELHIFLNVGKAEAVMYTCDLTEEYVEFNKGDVGDPASMGG